MEYKIENLVITDQKNVWGWYVGSAFINGVLLSMRYDHKPKTQKQVKADLIRLYERN